MTNEIVVTKLDTGTPGARDSRMPPTAASSANTIDRIVAYSGLAVT